MSNAIKILAYGCIGLSCSTAALTAAGTLLELAAEKGLRRCLTQQPAKFARPLNVRYFSSAIDDAWNNGYVPIRRHDLRPPTDNDNVSKRTNFLQTEVTWHFDPVRSLYYYFKDEVTEVAIMGYMKK